MPEISRFCQTVSRMSPSPICCAIAASPRICAAVSLPTGSTTPIQCRPFCFCGCTPICAPRSNAGRGASASAGTRTSFAAELLLDQREIFVEAHGVEHVFHPRLVAVGAVAVVDEDADDGVGHLGGVGGLDDDAGVAGEILVSGDAAEREAEPDAGLDAEAVLHLDRLEADVVGVLQHRDAAGAVERDVELARQAVERALVEDVEVPFARVGPRVDQFLRIDAGGRRAGDVADVVGAGAARAEAEILDRFEQRDRVLRLDLADLQIGAGGDMGIAAAVALGEIGEAGRTANA